MLQWIWRRGAIGRSVDDAVGLLQVRPVYLVEIFAVAEDVERDVFYHRLDIVHVGWLLVLHLGVDGALQATETEVVQEAVLLLKVCGQRLHGHDVVGASLVPTPVGDTHLATLLEVVFGAEECAVDLKVRAPVGAAVAFGYYSVLVSME